MKVPLTTPSSGFIFIFQVLSLQAYVICIDGLHVFPLVDTSCFCEVIQALLDDILSCCLNFDVGMGCHSFVY